MRLWRNEKAVYLILTILILLFTLLLYKSLNVNKQPRKDNRDVENQMEVYSVAIEEMPGFVEISESAPKEDESYYISGLTLSKNLQKYLYETCKEFGVDYIEAHGVLRVENTSYDPKAVNKNSNNTIDVGLFQINSVNHKWLKKDLGITDFKDPYQSIRAGVYMLSHLSEYTPDQRFTAYNMGVGGMKKYASRGNSGYSSKVYNSMNYIRRLQNESNTR